MIFSPKSASRSCLKSRSPRLYLLFYFYFGAPSFSNSHIRHRAPPPPFQWHLKSDAIWPTNKRNLLENRDMENCNVHCEDKNDLVDNDFCQINNLNRWPWRSLGRGLNEAAVSLKAFIECLANVNRHFTDDRNKNHSKRLTKRWRRELSAASYVNWLIWFLWHALVWIWQVSGFIFLM